MTLNQFVEWMEDFVERREEVIRKLDVLYNEAFLDLVEWYGNVCYDTLAVRAMRLALNDETELLSYFIYDCNCDFEKFNDSVDCKGADGTESPDVWSYEDLYFLITGGQHE